jgi:hypothetical protein
MYYSLLEEGEELFKKNIKKELKIFGYSKEIINLILNMLSKDPQNRYHQN